MYVIRPWGGVAAPQSYGLSSSTMLAILHYSSRYAALHTNAIAVEIMAYTLKRSGNIFDPVGTQELPPCAGLVSIITTNDAQPYDPCLELQ